MTNLHPDLDVAKKVLTDVQLTRWILRHIRGWSWDQISRTTGASKPAIRESVRAAETAITRHKETQCSNPEPAPKSTSSSTTHSA